MTRLLLFLLLASSAAAQALTVDLRRVEIDLSLRPNGRAEVLYHIAYRVSSGEMHGFYFQGAAGTPHFDPRGCFAEPRDGSGERIPPTPMCLFNPLAHGLGNKSCAACDGLLSLSPTGGVLPCSSFDAEVGNLVSQGFAEVWGCEQARFYRDKRYAPEACRECPEFTACACPLYWEAVGFEELPHHAAGETSDV